MLRNTGGFGGVRYPGKKHYEGARFNALPYSRILHYWIDSEAAPANGGSGM